MSSPVRRNDPCPCGSGRRFKECHGRLEAGAPPSIDAQLQRALQLHQQGQVDEAERRYRQVLEQAPGNAIATHYLGMAAWQRGDVATGERLMREALAADARIPDFHSNLGILLRDTGRLEEAIGAFRAALGADAGYFEAYNNLGLTLESADRFPEACQAYREAIGRAPRFAAARQNLGRALLTLGEFAEGWEQYRWRLAAHGLAAAPPEANAPRLPASLAGRRFALRAEQGLGDVLFFLRFAPELVRRGAALAFRGDMRLAPLLARTGHFTLGCEAERAPAPGLEPVFVGDLPWLLEADDPARFPPPLAIAPEPERVARVRERVAAAGPAPFVGLAWRAGVALAGPVRTLSKQMPFEVLAGRARGRRATWVSVQREPRAGEHAALEAALGAPVLNLSGANADLEEILAVMAALDDYVGVSNTNIHLRAGLGLPMEVLVPPPPEWRWMASGERSPWFPTARVVRITPSPRPSP